MTEARSLEGCRLCKKQIKVSLAEQVKYVSKNLLESMQTMQSGGNHKAKELCSCKEIWKWSSLQDGNIVKRLMVTGSHNVWKFFQVLSCVSTYFLGRWGVGGCVIRIPLTSTRIFFSYLVQESSLAARLSPSDSLQQSLVMDGNRTAKRRTSNAVQKDKEMFVNFLAAPCKRKITTRTI